MNRHFEQAELEPNMRDNILNAHKNFLGMAVYHLYKHNRKKAAQEWFNYLLAKYPNAIRPELGKSWMNTPSQGSLKMQRKPIPTG